MASTRERQAAPAVPSLPPGAFGALDEARARALVEIGLALAPDGAWVARRPCVC